MSKKDGKQVQINFQHAHPGLDIPRSHITVLFSFPFF